MNRHPQTMAALVCAASLATMNIVAVLAEDALKLDDRREVFWDMFLIDSMQGCEFRQHRPEAREVVLFHDAVPWEGNNSWLHTVIRDGEKYRMYYLGRQLSMGGESGANVPLHPLYFATAESRDGITWTRPSLDRVPVPRTDKSKDAPNNLISLEFEGKVKGIQLLFPFRDENPACPAEARFKALSSRVELPDGRLGLYALRSADGIDWRLMSDKPVLTGCTFDSYNQAFWDPHAGIYRAYVRHRRGEELVAAVRDIMTATSKDFLLWGELAWLDYGGVAEEHVYNPNVQPYPRAPHIYVGFPLRYVQKEWNWHACTVADSGAPSRRGGGWRGGVAPRYGSAYTEPWFMHSRDGSHFTRSTEPFIHARRGCWAYGDNCVASGMVMTTDMWYGARHGFEEMSFYVVEAYHETDAVPCRVRRYALRPDGFVSIHAGSQQGVITTKPFIFKGKMLGINVQTAIGGSVSVELLDAQGRPYLGFEKEDCWDIYGDSADHTVFWNGGVDLGKLEGKPIRLRFLLREADLYALKFWPSLAEKEYREEMIRFWYGGAKKDAYLDAAHRKFVEFSRTIRAGHGEGPLSAKAISEGFRTRCKALLADTPISQEDYLAGLTSALGNMAEHVMLASVPRLKQQPTIDGRVLAEEWRAAGALGNLVVFDKQSGQRKALPFPTSVQIGYDERNLYIAYCCKEKNLDGLIGAAEERDGYVWRGDAVEFVFQPDIDKPDIAQIIVGANGKVWDAFRHDSKWNGNAEFAMGKSAEEGLWTVEVAVPWTDLRVKPERGALYRANFGRDDTDSEFSSWRPLPGAAFNSPVFLGFLQLN
jgi:hypothetical protein